MKKRKITFFCIVILLVFLFPIKIHYKDGGSVGYKAVLYEVIKHPAYMGATEGIEIEILGLNVYNNVILPGGMIFVDEDGLPIEQ